MNEICGGEEVTDDSDDTIEEWEQWEAEMIVVERGRIASEVGAEFTFVDSAWYGDAIFLGI